MINKHRSLSISSIAFIAAAGLFAVAGCTHHESSPSTTPPAPVQALNPNPTQVQLPYVAKKDQLSHADGNGMLPNAVSLAPDSPTPAKDALVKLAGESDSPLPKGTKVLSVNIDDKTHLATADFSPEFEKNFPGGDTQEAQVVSSVLMTFGQFPNVENVQFLVDGKKIASLGGTQDLDDPLPVIRPDQTAKSEPKNVAMDDGQ
ncbi:MAG TPA: GerMN domain-containing protein [Capsulimonadaceae bacterium]|nr:GerMN domain-containing protein [Capsulimonadaceae bacterium]